MSILYIILGIVLIALAIYFLDRFDKVPQKTKEIKEKKNDIEALNQQLDDLTLQLRSINDMFTKVEKTLGKFLHI